MPSQQAAKHRQNSVTLVCTIFETLRGEIASGVLPAGQPLSRRALAERFACSYATIVEVMVRLENTELIEAETAQMARVVRPTLERLRDAHVLIEAYETEAIRLACESATSGEIDELYRQAEALETRIAACDLEDHQTPVAHMQFHQRIAWLGRAPSLVRAMERSQLLVRCQNIGSSRRVSCPTHPAGTACWLTQSATATRWRPMQPCEST